MRSDRGPGDLALGLVNLLSESGEASVHATPRDVIAWLESTTGRESGMGIAPPRARLLLDEALRLRDAIAALLEAWSTARALPQWALQDLDRVLATSPEVLRLETGRDGVVVTTHVVGSAPSALMGPVARSMVRLLTEAERDRLRRCAAADCNRWFLDTSKGGRRRWCSMARCGNRAKAARHRARRVGKGPG